MMGETTRLIINVPPRYGKAIDVNTMMLTSEGWCAAGDIKIGDYLVGSQGFTKVTGVFPQGVLPAKQVLFSDGQSVVCNDQHMWTVYNRHFPDHPKTLLTSEIAHSLYEPDGHKRWRVPLVNGDYGNNMPFIDPYLFGCWLGDGHSHYAAITSMDEEIIQAFRDKGYEMRLHTHQNSGQAKTYGILGLSRILRQSNLLKNKHIPVDCYLWAPWDRLALLQGLMDTDGTCGKNGQVSFTNTNHNIIDGVGYLVNSLGGTYKVYTRRCGTQTLNIRLPDDIDPFRLARKQQYVSKGLRCAPRRLIESVVDCEPTEMVCFTVDAHDHLFAVGEGLILTHNTELLINFVAWALAQYPDSNFLYVSYSLGLAKKQTKTIRQIVGMLEYRDLFGLGVSGDTSAQGNFETTLGGTVYAAGADGEITGRGAGIKGVNRFGGCIIIDDIHKPSEVTSDTIRKSVNEWYFSTLQSRLNDPDKTPIIFIGQRLHEDDLAANLIKTGDWETVIIPALDEAGNPLHPSMHNAESLAKMREMMPYVYASQYQQDPMPAGGGIFKADWFYVLDEEPEILTTFITADTAETDKSYNDATVFSFFGLYKIKHGNIETDLMGIHWLNCIELRIEPKDLESEFMNFYTDCMRYKVRPRVAAIERKSTGVTLLSVLKNVRGLQIMDIPRTRVSGSKTARFLEIQPYIASGQVSLPKDGKHTEMCIEHMRKITANNSHRKDDICDTIYDGIKLGIIDNVIMAYNPQRLQDEERVAKGIMGTFQKVLQLRGQR
jgi:predicted phage terminase large subunit-like protein